MNGMLVDVCPRWRRVVFASLHRLDLRPLCTETHVREMLDVWPTLPVDIWYNYNNTTLAAAASTGNSGNDDVIVALKHCDRACKISLRGVPSSQFERLAGATQNHEPFPALTSLVLRSEPELAPAVLPESFLGGSAPRLRTLRLDNVAFPALPKLLRSAGGDLVHLYLWGIPDAGYVSPEAMAGCLSALTKLKSLRLGFRSPRPIPPSESSVDIDARRRHSCPPPRSNALLVPGCLWIFGGPRDRDRCANYLASSR